MSESLSDFQEYRRTRWYPNDPYDDGLMQAGVLKQMGYPVELIPMRSQDLGDIYPADEYFQWKRQKFQFFTKVVFHNGFEEYVEDPDVTGDIFDSNDPELDKLLSCHPMQLAAMVDAGYVDQLAYELEETLEVGKPRYAEHQNPDFPWLDLMRKCVVAAGRRKLAWVAESPLADDGDMRAINRGIDMYRMLVRQGVEPVNPEQLAGLMSNYYMLVEQNFPEFAAHKTGSAPNIGYLL